MCNRPEGSPHPRNARNAIFNCYATAILSMHNLLFSRKNLSTGRRNRLVNDYCSLLLLVLNAIWKINHTIFKVKFFVLIQTFRIPISDQKNWEFLKMKSYRFVQLLFVNKLASNFWNKQEISNSLYTPRFRDAAATYSALKMEKIVQ